jgi:hypothetical protein
MSSVLTCDCGARFEVDALGRGQPIRCPECLQSLQAAVDDKPAPRPGWLALTALALALLGGFTVVGSLAGAALGLAVLVQVRRHPDRLAGAGFALSAVLLGVGLTGVSLVLFRSRDLLPVGAWLRQRTMGPTEPVGSRIVSSRDDVCLLRLPSDDWLRVKGATSGDPAIEELQQKRDVLLVSLRLRAFADVTIDTAAEAPTLADYHFYLLKDLQPPPPPALGDGEEASRSPAPRFRGDSALDPIDGHEGREWLLDLDRGGRTWRFLVRAYRHKDGKKARPAPFYLVRAYAPRGRFVEHEEEIRRLLDSVRFQR